MTLFQTNIYTPISVTKDESLQCIDIFDTKGEKTIELHAHSSLTYLVVCSHADVAVEIITT